jgi:hypothetical protein
MTPTRRNATAVRAASEWPSALALTLISCVSVTLGALIAHGDLVVTAFLVGLPVAAWLTFAHPGIAVGLLWLAALNGIPLINLRSGVGEFKPTDLAVIAILLMASFHWSIFPGARHPLPRGVAMICGLFGGWWLVTLVRSLAAGIPLADAFFFGRDFLSLIVVIPAAWIVLRIPRAWRECVVVILLGTGVYALAYVAGALGFIDATRFTHPNLILSFGSIQRLYTPVNDLVITVFVFSMGVLATTRRNRATPWIVVLATITLIAFLLQLTRAAYLGVALGGLIAVAIALTRGADVRQVLIRRATVLLVALGILFFVIIGLGSTGNPTRVVSQRVSSGLAAIEERSGTVSYRTNLYHHMLQVLGTEWPIGLGFLHPRDRYFPSLPQGDIRNTDVGLMNAVMTMGVLGLGLLLGVLLAFARYMAQTRSRRPPWMVVGFFGWLVVLLAGSPTLVTLFGATGILSTALTLVLCGLEAARWQTGSSISDQLPDPLD